MGGRCGSCEGPSCPHTIFRTLEDEEKYLGSFVKCFFVFGVSFVVVVLPWFLRRVHNSLQPVCYFDHLDSLLSL